MSGLNVNQIQANKKLELMQRAAKIFTLLQSDVTTFKTDINNLIDSLDSKDLESSYVVENIFTDYELTLQTFISSFMDHISINRNTSSDDGTAVIKQISGNSTSSQLFHTQYEQTSFGEISSPPQIVCVFDNISVTPKSEFGALIGYDFKIGKTSYVIDSSHILVQTPQYDAIKDNLNTIKTNASYIQELCRINTNIINNYIANFKKLFIKA
jgi:hypothetical protein